MPRGESFVGRALDCQLRFNDAAVSRRHLRVICRKDNVHIENLSMVNEARLNGQPLTQTCQLQHGDTLQIAHRLLGVKLLLDGVPSVDAGSTEQPSIEEVSENWAEETIPGADMQPYLASGVVVTQERNCPKCRERVCAQEAQCSNCDYQWPSHGHAASTQKIVVPHSVRRESRRQIVRVPVIYSSEDLSLDVIARDLGRGGMFLASEILEPVGTECQITALPDGRPALFFKAVVCHVSTESIGGSPSGFGVSFREVSAEAQRWLRVTTEAQDD